MYPQYKHVTKDCQTFRNAKQIPAVRSYQSVALTDMEDRVYLDKQINIKLCVSFFSG
jgi:hypothetical protein